MIEERSKLGGRMSATEVAARRAKAQKAASLLLRKAGEQRIHTLEAAGKKIVTVKEKRLEELEVRVLRGALFCFARRRVFFNLFVCAMRACVFLGGALRGWAGRYSLWACGANGLFSSVRVLRACVPCVPCVPCVCAPCVCACVCARVCVCVRGGDVGWRV